MNHEQKIAEIREALEKATQGPWAADDENGIIWSPEAKVVIRYTADEEVEDIELIANAPEWLRFLLSELDKRDKLIGALNGLVQEFYRLSRDYHRIYKGQSEEYDEHAYGKHWAFDDAAQMLEALLKEHGVTVE